MQSVVAASTGRGIRAIDVAFGTLVVVGLAAVLSTAVPEVPPLAATAVTTVPVSSRDGTLAAKPGSALFSLDTIGIGASADVVVAGHPRPSVIAPVGSSLRIGGWAVDPATGKPVSAVLLAVDGHVLARSSIGIQRPDVAAALHLPDAAASGFRAELARDHLPLGHHTVELRFVDTAGDGYYVTPVRIAVTIRPNVPGTVRP